MILNNERKLTGQLIGLAKRKKDGLIDTIHEVGTIAIKNTIVQSGIKHLLCYNGSNTDGATDYTTSDTGTYIRGYIIGNLRINSTNTLHHGILSYASYGSSNATTNISMTDLVDRRITQNDNRITGSPYTCMNIYNWADFSYVVTHELLNNTGDSHIVREVGWHGRYGSSPIEYPLFSRVILPEEITILDGESLRVTYELRFTLPTSVENILDMGITGYPIGAQKRSVFRGNVSNNLFTTSAAINTFTHINSFGVESSGNASSSQNSPYLFPFTAHLSTGSGSLTTYHNTRIMVSNTPNKTFPPLGGADSQMLSSTITKNGIYEQSFIDYIDGNNFRDFRKSAGHMWPSLTVGGSIDIWYLSDSGYAYRFGDFDANMNFTPRPLVKGSNQRLTLITRTTISTG